MPPRFAYWTILIDNAPTAFRARDPQELLPTLNQLKRKNKDVAMKWFARGRLWESQQQERDDFQRRKRPADRATQRREERRGRDWRPGGEHKDPRARFDKKTRAPKPRRERARAKGAHEQPPKREARHDQRQEHRRDQRQEHRHDQRQEHRRDQRQEHRHGQRHDQRPGQRHDQRPGQRHDQRHEPKHEPRRERPDRAPSEPPPRRTGPPSEGTPEPPPAPEQIVIKPEPPERG